MRLIRRHPLLTVFGALLVAGVVVIAASAVVVWRAAHHDAAADIEVVDAIVVLGAAQYDGDPSPVFQGRLDHAALLWSQDRADVVITLGSKQQGDRTTEADAGRRYLLEKGLPAASVVAIPTGHTTYDSLAAASRYLHENDLQAVFLVSDPWHNARIVSMAGDLGLRGYASATWTSGATSGGTRGRGYLRETFAYLHYRVFGG